MRNTCAAIVFVLVCVGTLRLWAESVFVDELGARAQRSRTIVLEEAPLESDSTRLQELGVFVLRNLPSRLPSVLVDLPVDSATVDQVYGTYKGGKDTFGPEWSETVREWLILNSSYYLAELAQRAESVVFQDGAVEGCRYVDALCEQDHGRAVKALRSLMESDSQQIRAYANSRLFRLDGTSQVIRTLTDFSGDHRASGYARAVATQVLLGEEWPGRDEWLARAFGDVTLWELREGRHVYDPLIRSHLSSGKLVATAVSLLEEPKCERNAVRVIASRLTTEPIVSTRALLPALRGEWDDLVDKRRVIWMLRKYPIAGSVPYLEEYVADRENVHWCDAVIALAAQAGRHAVPVLREALAECGTAAHTARIVEALYRNGGYSSSEVVRVLGEYLDDKELSTEHRALAEALSTETLPLPTEITTVLAGRMVNEEVLNALRSWSTTAANRFLVSLLEEGRATAECASLVLERRKDIAREFATDLRKMQSLPGHESSLSSVVLEDQERLSEILRSDRIDDIRIVLAAAAIGGVKLEPELVAPLLVRDETEPEARAYLERDGRVSSAKILAQTYQDSIVPAPSAPVSDAALALFKECRDGRAKRIIALLAHDSHEDDLVIREFEDYAEFMQRTSTTRFGVRRISNAEFKLISTTTSQLLVAEPVRYEHRVSHTSRYDLVDVSAAGGRSHCIEALGLVAENGEFKETRECALIRRFEFLAALGSLVWRDKNAEASGLEIVPEIDGWVDAVEMRRGELVVHRLGHWESTTGTVQDEPWKQDLAFSPRQNPGLANGSARARGRTVVAGSLKGKSGLWACGRDGVSLLVSGPWAYPIVTRSPTVIVAMNLRQERAMFAIDLETGETRRVFGPREGLRPIGRQPDGTVLVRTHGGEYWGVDAMSGESRRVTGELWPYEQERLRPLQPHSKTHLAWAARPDERANHTVVGLYDRERRKFEPKAVVSGLLFDSMQLWVDPDQNALWVVTEGRVARGRLDRYLPRE